MDLHRVVEKFGAMGAEFVGATQPVSRWDRTPAAPYSLQVEREGRAERFVLRVVREAQEYIAVEVPAFEERRKVLLLGVRLFDSYTLYLCSTRDGRWYADAVPVGTPAGLRDAISAIEAQRREAEARDAEKAEAVYRAREARRALRGVPTLEAVHRIVPVSTTEYAFLVELLDRCSRMKLGRDEGPVIPQYGTELANTYRVALMRVAQFSGMRVRDLDEWKPKSHNAHKQFGSLVRHLFSKYEIPGFLDSLWFRADRHWLPWFIAVGGGANIRTMAGLPIALTKKMAHAMFQASDRLCVEEAFRWGQIAALGGNDRFYHAILGTRMPRIGADDANPAVHGYWQTVIEWFLRNPMLDPLNYGPIVDYIAQQRADGAAFEITGRSPVALLRLVDEWHGALGRASRRPKVTWTYRRLDWRWEEKVHDKLEHVWEMHEVCDSHELLEEGRAMRHCVYTYTNSCATGRCSILSLRRDEERVLTVEYLPHSGLLGEIRGHCNRWPEKRELSIVKRWAADKGLKLASLMV